MVFDLCDDTAECLSRLELGTLFGCWFTTDRGVWARGPLLGAKERSPVK